MTIASRLKNFFRTLRLRRVLLYGGLSLLVVLLFLVVLVAALPTILSTGTGQNLLRKSLSSSLKRQVAWTELNLSWSRGLALKGLSLGPGPAPLLKASVGDALLLPKISYRNGRPRIDLSLRVGSLTAELAPGPPQPPKPYREPLSAIAQGLQQFEGLDWPLPIDLGVQVALDPVQLSYLDPQTGRKVTLKNGSLHLDLPSLAVAPVAFEMRGDLDLAGQRLEALSLRAELKHLVSPARHLHPAAALLSVTAELPGTTLTVLGGLQEPNGLNARARLDLPRVMPLIAPFLPPKRPAVGGALTLDLQARADARHNLRAALELNGSSLSLSGGPLGKGRVGPLELRVRQQVVSDHQRQQVRFTDGSAKVGNWLEAVWQAGVERPSDKDRDLTAQLGPARVDLRQLLAQAGPLLPPQFPVRELTGELSLRQLQVHLHGRKDQGEAALSGLGLHLPLLRLVLGKDKLSADGVALVVDKVTIPLAGQRPTRVDAALSYGLQRVALTGVQPLTANDLHGNLNLSLTDLKLKSPTSHRVAAGVGAQQSPALLVRNQEPAPPASLVPGKAEATFSYALRRLALAGQNPLVADDLTGNLRLSLSDLELQGTAPRRMSPAVATKSPSSASGPAATKLPSAAPPAASRAAAPSASLLPSKLDAALSYAVRRLARSGAQPLVADAVRGDLQLSLKDLNLKSASPRKVAATAELKQSLDLLRVSLEGKLLVDKFHEQLEAGIKAKETGEIEAALQRLQLSAGALQAKASAKDLKPVAFNADLSAVGIRLPAAPGAPPSVERFDCTASGGDFLKLVTSGALAGAPSRLATSEGSLRLDLGRALPLLSAFLPKGTAAGGTDTVTWKLALPTGQKPAPTEKDPLRAAKASLAQLDRGEIDLTLANSAIAYPLSGGTVQLAELRTAQPLHIALPGKGGVIRLQGGIAFTGLQGLPGSAAALPPQNGSLTLQGELSDWQSLKLHQELKIEQFGMLEQADASIGRIDALLERKEPLSAALLLQRLDANLSAQLSAHFPAQPTLVPGGAKLSGDLSAGVRVNLSAGRELRVRASALTRDFGARLADGTALEGVNADLLVDRSYALAKGGAVGWTPLSTSLVRPGPEPFGGQGAAELVDRVREDLRGQERGSRRFTVRRIVTAAGKGSPPIELTSLEGDLLFTPEQVGLSFLQAELLGGTLRLRGLVDLKPEVPAVSAACSFSNLETYLLLPAESRKQSLKGRQDTAVTGELTFDAPLLTGERELLEGVRMQLNLRKIGADTLERALFGLDPYERNEQIVAQRKLLRQGTLKRLRAGTLDGSFSFDGDVLVRGVNVALPKAERIRLSDLPIQKQLAQTVAGVASARKLLDMLRADTLSIGPKGGISLGRRGHE
jgi:hypothetical protein